MSVLAGILSKARMPTIQVGQGDPERQRAMSQAMTAHSMRQRPSGPWSALGNLANVLSQHKYQEKLDTEIANRKAEEQAKQGELLRAMLAAKQGGQQTWDEFLASADSSSPVMQQMLMQQIQAPPPKPPEKDIHKAKDGFLYDANTGQRVFPDVVAPEAESERQILKAQDGRHYYVDTQEPVFPGVQPPAGAAPEREIRKASDGNLYYVDTQERVFPDVVAPEAESERRIIQGQDGRKYYEDTKEPVLPGVEKAPDALPSKIQVYEYLKANDLLDDPLAERLLGVPSTVVNVGDQAPYKVPGNYMMKDPENPDAGIKPIPGGPAEGKVADTQARAWEVAVRTSRLLPILAQTTPDGRTIFEALSSPVERGLDAIPFAGNYALTKEYQQADQAIEDVVQGFLRLETGAAAPHQEVKKIAKRYKPRPGDSPEVIAQKWNTLLERAQSAEQIAGSEFSRIQGLTDYDALRLGPEAFGGGPAQQKDLSNVPDEELLKMIGGAG